jgi:serpin B
VKHIVEWVLVAGCVVGPPSFLCGCSSARGSAGNVNGGAPTTPGGVTGDADPGDADSPFGPGDPDPGQCPQAATVPVGSPDSDAGDDGGTDCGTMGVSALVDADTAFAMALLPVALVNDGGIADNAVVSPFSISSALMMVDVGAAGETDSQIQSVLSLPDNGAAEASAHTGLVCALQAAGSSNGNSLVIANSLWGQQGVAFLTPFLDVLATGYDAPLQTVDFESNPAAAAATINAWVSQATQGNIASPLGPQDVTDLTRLVAVNAVYFKGTWATGFDPSQTSPRPFTRADGTQTTVSTMSGLIYAGVRETSGLLVVELPYLASSGSALAMDILMPEADAGLATFEGTLTPATLSSALASLPGRYGYTIQMPKFSFSTRVELQPVLAALGMSDVFEHGVADLSGMDGAMDLYVTAVVQQAMVEVDEQGTVAAAVTAAVSGCGSVIAAGPPLVQIDRAFFFLIRDVTNGAIVFMGQVVDPGG